MKLVKENCVSKYGDSIVKWWLKEGTKHLPALYFIKGAYSWCAYDENDKLIFESMDANLRLKKDAVSWIESYDELRDIQLAKEAEEEAQRQAEYAEQIRVENEYNESYKKDVENNFNAKVGDVINVQLFTLSKLNSLGDGYVYDKDCGYNPQVNKAKIEEIKVVSQEVYDEFVDSFYNSSLSRSFSGGGNCIDSDEINAYNSYMDLPSELREYYNKNCYDLVTIVIADKRLPIVVNPHGYDYVRYAGIVA